MTGSCECGNEPSGYIKCGGISWKAAELLAFQEGLCCMELVVRCTSSYAIQYGINPKLETCI
jgi:hypothetical protein